MKREVKEKWNWVEIPNFFGSYLLLPSINKNFPELTLMKSYERNFIELRFICRGSVLENSNYYNLVRKTPYRYKIKGYYYYYV